MIGPSETSEEVESPLYQEHFGLQKLPFSETVDPGEAITLPSRDAARRRLRYGIEQGQGPAALLGAPGSGKTLVGALLARELGSRTVHLTYPLLSTDELLAYLADELDGIEGQRRSASPSLHQTLGRLRRRLAGPAFRGRPPLLIVDEAHLIPDPNCFEALRMLQNFSSEGRSHLMLLLVGGPELILQIPPSLNDRLTTRYVLGPLSSDESATYITGRLANAGCSQPLFDQGQLQRLHEHAQGLPRRLNRIADLSLLISFAEGLPRPNDFCIEVALREATPRPGQVQSGIVA